MMKSDISRHIYMIFFSIKDLGELHYFLGVEVSIQPNGFAIT